MQPVSKVLIFGSNGQDGYYLRELLKRKNINHIGVSRGNSDIKGDVSDYDFVYKQIFQYKPTHIFHFAANSTTRHEAIFDNHLSISTGTLNILESVRLLCPDIKVFISGSAMQFKNNGTPIDENTPFDASSPYSVARIQSVYAARYYRTKFCLKVYVGYFFHHDSPLRTEKHVNQKIVIAVKRINSGSKEKLKLRNIEFKKEFNYAADLVEAAWILINQNSVFEAVIGSGKAFSIRDWLECCFNEVEKRWQDYVQVESNFVDENKVLVSKPTLIKSLGWEPQVNFTQLVDIMMNNNN